MNPVLFSSERQDWATPWDRFEIWNERYGPFDLDVCALPHNAKCERYFTPEEDGLKQPWDGVCWMNPPYGRGIIDQWMEKANKEINFSRVKRIVCLLPARTDTAWWHDYVLEQGWEKRFIRGRIKFEGAANSAPFPSVLVVME